MAYNLSEGSIEMIMKGEPYDKPVMQVLGSKNIQDSEAINERYRLLVSDGKHFHSFALLATHLNEKLICGQLSDYSVVQINGFVTLLLKNTRKGEKRVMIIQDLTIMASGSVVGKKLGNPQNWSGEAAAPPPQPQREVAHAAGPAPKEAQPAPGPSRDHSLPSSQATLPIDSLSPYQIKWVIKARVMTKSPIRTWSNAKGEGKLFSMALCDESGEIRATAFKNECEKFYDIIQVDKVYYISRGRIKTANKQFSSLKNDYEMTFSSTTVVAECLEGALPAIKCDFVPINEIENKAVDSILDVIGVCKSTADVQELTARSTGKLLKKRELTLVDSTGGAKWMRRAEDRARPAGFIPNLNEMDFIYCDLITQVVLTLWDDVAENFDGSTNPVVLVKGARLTEFNGSKSLTCLYSSTMRLNADLPEAHRLRGWYDNGGADMDTVNISAKSGMYSGGSKEWLTFSDADNLQLGTGDSGDVFSHLGVVTTMLSEKAVYKACPQEKCNKKLVDQANGLFQCEKCNREHPNYKYRLLLTGHVSDPTGDQRVTAFNEAAEAMLGQPAEEVGRLFEHDKNAYVQLFEHLKFKTFIFNYRTKMETWNDEARLKTIVMNAQPVDYIDANARLIKSITSITGVEV